VAFTFVLRDRATAIAQGEFRNVSQRSIRFPFLKTPTFTGTIAADHPAASLLLNLDNTIISGYDLSIQTDPLFQGPVVAYQKQRTSQGGTIQFTAAGIGWRLDHRLIGKSNTGATFGTTSISLLDRGEIMGRIIDALNTGEASNIFADAGDTGIRRGTITASSSTFVGPWRYKIASEALADLSGTLDGPDFRIRPVAPTADAVGVQFGALDVAAAFGQVQPNVAFEYGTGQDNVAEWSDVGDSTTLANRAVSLPSGFPDNAVDSPIQWDDATAIADRGLYETVVAADLLTSDLRTKLAQEHVRVRKMPRRVISFTPVAEDPSLPLSERRVPRLFADFNIGDVVTFRAVEHLPITDTAGTIIGISEQKTADLLMRVFGAELAIDDNGVAQTRLTLADDGSS
jgi:hypothetical protein